jgi:nucleotide-binding universal stress UspA family protein
MKVLIAADVSPAAETLIDMLTHRHWPHGSHFHVITVVETTTGRFAYHPFMGTQQELEGEVEVAASRLAGLLHKLRDRIPHATITGGVVAGGAVESICAKAAEMKADLVVVGHQGTYGQGGYSLGGVAERVVHHAPCSVIVVKPKIETKDMTEKELQGAAK